MFELLCLANKHHGIGSKRKAKEWASDNNQNVGVGLVLSYGISHSELILSFDIITDGPQFICFSTGDTTVFRAVVTIRKWQLLLVSGLQDASRKKKSDNKNI